MTDAELKKLLKHRPTPKGEAGEFAELLVKLSPVPEGKSVDFYEGFLCATQLLSQMQDILSGALPDMATLTYGAMIARCLDLIVKAKTDYADPERTNG